MATTQPRVPMLDAMEILKEAWNHYAKNWQVWVPLGLLFFVAAMVLACTCIGAFFIPVLMAGMYVAAFKQLRGQNPEISDIFAGFPWFGPTLVASLLVGICCFLGTLACIIPGLIFHVWWAFALPLCVSHGVNGSEAMSMSKRKVQEGFWDVVVLLLVIFGVSLIAGFLPLGGMWLGFPLQILMTAIAHRDLFGLEGAQPPLRGQVAGLGGPAAPPAPQAVACARCNALNAAGTRFCTGCGAPLA